MGLVILVSVSPFRLDSISLLQSKKKTKNIQKYNYDQKVQKYNYDQKESFTNKNKYKKTEKKLKSGKQIQNSKPEERGDCGLGGGKDCGLALLFLSLE